MKDLTIKYSDLQTAIKLSTEINRELDNSYKIANDLKKYLSSAKWSGETKITFEAYLSLIVQYHKDLIDIMLEHEKAVRNLKESIDDYNYSPEVSEIKGL